MRSRGQWDGVIDAVRASMRANRSANTTPEMRLRSLLWADGYRYRLHRKDLPGRPDIVFPGRKKAIFVHGCFWHQHAGCRRASVPKSRTDYWGMKLQRNQARDAAALQGLQEIGWSSLVVWECELRDHEAIRRKVHDFLTTPQALGPRPPRPLDTPAEPSS